MVPEGTSVTLIEPQYPVNLGHVARLVKNFGVKKLCLVRPRVDFSVAAVYASHASDVLDKAQVLTFEEVRRENELLVATTAIRASRRSNVIRRPIAPERLRSLLLSSSSSSIVFGRDSTGLTNEEIRACDITTTIEVGTRYRTLNIGHAVAIVLYALSRSVVTKRQTQGKEARKLFAKSLYDLASASQLQPHRLRSLLETAERMAATSSLSDRQLNLVSGTLRRGTARIEGLQDRDSKT